MFITKIYIQNMKCSGCAKRIEEELLKIKGISGVIVNPDEDSITLECTHSAVLEQVKRLLQKLGYPESGTANTFGLKSKSYINCMIGKAKNAS